MYGHAGVQFYTQPKTVRTCLKPAKPFQSQPTMQPRRIVTCYSITCTIGLRIICESVGLTVCHAAYCPGTCARLISVDSGCTCNPDCDRFRTLGVRWASGWCNAGDHELEGSGRPCREPSERPGRGRRNGRQLWRSYKGPMSVTQRVLHPQSAPVSVHCLMSPASLTCLAQLKYRATPSNNYVNDCPSAYQNALCTTVDRKLRDVQQEHITPSAANLQRIMCISRNRVPANNCRCRRTVTCINIPPWSHLNKTPHCPSRNRDCSGIRSHSSSDLAPHMQHADRQIAQTSLAGLCGEPL